MYEIQPVKVSAYFIVLLMRVGKGGVKMHSDCLNSSQCGISVIKLFFHHVSCDVKLWSFMGFKITN